MLLHTGYFRYLALIAGGMAVAMTVMSIVVATMTLDIVGYLTAYAAVFAVSVLFSLFRHGPRADQDCGRRVVIRPSASPALTSPR